MPLLGFLPDAEVTEPGVLVDCVNFIPTLRGMAGGPSAQVAVPGLAALAAACRGAAVLVDTAGARRNFAGTQTKLYELVSTSWTDRSRAGNYTGSTESRWSFTQFGNLALAADGVAVIQSSASGAFADTATAPVAKIVISAKDFVLAFDTSDGTFGVRRDAWWCSAFQNGSLWTPSVATQATTGRLVGVPGPITAAAMLGAYAVAYKERGAYLGQYVGPPAAWQWDAVPSEFGCVGQEAVCDIGGAHFVVGPDDIWLFDGTRPRSLGEGTVKEWFYRDLSPTYRSRVICAYDRASARVWVFYPSVASTGSLDSALVFGIAKGRWGRANRTIEAVFRFVAPGVTMDTLDSVGATFDTLPMVPFDSPTWNAAATSLAIFDSGHNLRALTGTSEASQMTTGDLGEDWGASFVNRVALRFIKEPTTSSAVGATRETQGGPLTTRSNSQIRDDNAYDVAQDGRWHAFTFDFTGDVECSGLLLDAQAAGTR
jgi:hypothetical protein